MKFRPTRFYLNIRNQNWSIVDTTSLVDTEKVPSKYFIKLTIDKDKLMVKFLRILINLNLCTKLFFPAELQFDKHRAFFSRVASAACGADWSTHTSAASNTEVKGVLLWTTNLKSQKFTRQPASILPNQKIF